MSLRKNFIQNRRFYGRIVSDEGKSFSQTTCPSVYCRWPIAANSMPPKSDSAAAPVTSSPKATSKKLAAAPVKNAAKSASVKSEKAERKSPSRSNRKPGSKLDAESYFQIAADKQVGYPSCTPCAPVVAGVCRC